MNLFKSFTFNNNFKFTKKSICFIYTNYFEIVRGV